MVATVKTNETKSQLWARMAELAKAKGIVVWAFQLDPNDDVAFFASSASNPEDYHAVDVDRCDCKGFARVGHCSHIGALRLELGLIAPAPAVHVSRDEALAAIRAGHVGWDAGATFDIAIGDYPTPAEYRGLVALAKKRGVVIEGLDTNRPVAVESRGRYDLSIETCSCSLFVGIGCCQHHALFVELLADRADAAIAA